MRQTIIIFIATILLFSCSTKQDKGKIYYVIKHLEKIELDNDSMPRPPPPPKLFYGNYNFILLDTSEIFYHEKHQYYSCGSGIDLTRPPQLFLTPENLNEIKIKNLEVFLTSIPDSIISGRQFFASISTPQDTIRNRAFQIITDFFKSKNIRFYNLRRLTEEEQFVTAAKIGNTKYDPSKVDWKVGFDIKFTPPTDTANEK